MMFASTVIAAVAVLGPAVIAGPTPILHDVQRFSGTAAKGKYVIKFKNGADKSIISRLGPDVVKASWESINGFAAELNTTNLDTVRGDPTIDSIFEDGIISIASTVVQTDASWNLQRISQFNVLSAGPIGDLTWNYTYDSTGGNGVDVYVLDTGIRTTHAQFGSPSRASWGATFGGYADVDNNGHGTHCAGLAVGTQVGVAKNSKVIAVKVLGDDGNGFLSDVISGLNYVHDSAVASSRPAVASISIQGDKFTPLDDAVAAATSLGIHVVVAAGNADSDAGLFSPSGAPSAITVAATDAGDDRAPFSNWGPSVDIFAPGITIWSASIASDTALIQMTGTSQATPQVAGLAAYFIGKNGNTSPATLAAFIRSTSVPNAVIDPEGSPNFFAWNGL